MYVCVYSNTFLQGAQPPVIPLQGTPSPVNPLASGMKVCVRAYGASAFPFFKTLLP
jgi:hypothetical protein